MTIDLTKGSITKGLLLFSLPLIATNLLQQLYNLADTIIVGRFIGEEALAAVGSSSSFMTFITSVFLGLSMGAGAYISQCYGKGDESSLRKAKLQSFVLILIITVVLQAISELLLGRIMIWLNIPHTVQPQMEIYLDIILKGMIATLLSSFYASILRAIGDSVTPLIFLGISAITNIILDLYFTISLKWGVAGAAIATVISQYIAGIGLLLFAEIKYKNLRTKREDIVFDKKILKGIASLSILTSIQQSIMNLGILMVQGIVNSFGTAVMAAFASGVKIDSLAYMPLQDFGNAFSTFVAQNFGADNKERIIKGIKTALLLILIFSIIISSAIFFLSPSLMKFFTSDSNIIEIGVGYLRVEGVFYLGIGILFMLYGYYRAISKAGTSVVLTLLSLGTRVILAYILSKTILAYFGIWLSVPIGWAIADIYGIVYFFKSRNAKGVSK